MQAIHIHFPETIQGDISGRLLLFIDKRNSQGDLYTQHGISSCPFAGRTYYHIPAGSSLRVNVEEEGWLAYPFPLQELPATTQRIQAFFIRWQAYQRSDGHTIWGMPEQGGGGNITLAPGNLYSEVVCARWQKEEIHLHLNSQIPFPSLQENEVYQQGIYRDQERVRYFKVRSERLSRFWNSDIYLGFNILLPRHYSTKKSYPVLYYHGHWPGKEAPFYYGKDPEFTRFWEEEAPEMMIVSIRNANIFYDDSYLVNSANLGPWGDALIYEAIPALEKAFPIIPEAWARANAGGSTGGWESMALQVFYPKFFGGSWPMCPDAMTFQHFQIIDLYKDKNAYSLSHGWYQTERPACRDIQGNILWTVRQENQFELATGGDKAHGLGQWGIWEAVYSPVGEDGYPQAVWDAKTGKIDKKVVRYWHEHYDLLYYLQKHPEIYPDLKDKLHLRGGDMDNYYLNLSQYKIGDFLRRKKLGGYSRTFPRVGHSGNILPAALVQEIYNYMQEKKHG